MPPQNNPDRIRIVFDDHRLVANAGLLLPATLARHLGLRELVDHHLALSSRSRARVGAASRVCASQKEPAQAWTQAAWPRGPRPWEHLAPPTSCVGAGRYGGASRCGPTADRPHSLFKGPRLIIASGQDYTPISGPPARAIQAFTRHLRGRGGALNLRPPCSGDGA